MSSHMTKTEKSVAKSLMEQNRTRGRSWRVIAREDYHDLIKPGTLNRIAKSGGRYFPADPEIRELFGLPLKMCKTCRQKITVPRRVKTYRRLSDLRPDEVLYLLKNRSEF